MDHLALYSIKCKTCKSLDPEETKLNEKCHFSKGNTDCPAQEVQLVVVGEAKRFASAVKKARANGKIEEEVRILEAVAKKSAAFQFKFREWSSK